MTQIRQTIDVNAPLASVYHQWTRFEDFPRFMDGVREVRQRDDAHLHWRAHRHGRELEWDSEIVEQVPDQRIVWRDVGGPGNHGSVRFAVVKPDTTRVELTMETAPRAVAAATAQHDDELRIRLEQDLIRFKQLLEAQAQTSAGDRGENRDENHDAQATQRASADEASSASTSTSPAPGSQASAAQAWLPGLLQGWEEPMIMMRKMSDEMDQLFERFLGRPMAFRFGQGGVTGKWMPTVEVAQRDGQLVICAELPGVRSDAVQVEIRQGKLLIEGERLRPADQTVPAGFRRSERSYGPFFRMVPLPEAVDIDQCSARLQDGLLEIRIALTAGGTQLGKRIDIHAD